MSWTQSQIDDETIFPIGKSSSFPKGFLGLVKTIAKRLFRVYAHIYHAHFDRVVALDEEVHLNTSFRHFMYFCLEFALVDRRELAPMEDFITSL